MCIGIGWLLSAGFVVCTAKLGGTSEQVRVFQWAWCAGFAGYLLLITAVLRSAAHGETPGHWRWWLIGCVLLRVVVLTTHPGNDAFRYVWEGRIQRAGFNPYAHPPDDPKLTCLRDDDWSHINHPDYSAIYGPVAQIEFAMIAAMHPSIYAIKGLHALWDCLTIVVLGACLRRKGYSPHRAIIYGLCPLVLSAFAAEGHLDSLMLFFVSLCIWAAIVKRMKLAGAMLGLAMGVKIVAVVLLPWFMLRDRRAAVVALVVPVVCYLPYVEAGWGLIESLVRFGSGGEFFSFLGAWRITSFQTHLSHRIAAALLAGAVIVLAWRRRDFADFAGGAFSVTLLAMPIVHYWYLSWVLMFLPFRVCWRWVAAAAAMAVYFEAHRNWGLTGEWRMPAWAPGVVWILFMVVWGVERIFQAKNRIS